MMYGLGNTTATQTSQPWWQGLIQLGAQTGANIAQARYGTVPVYSQTATPYGSSMTVYQPGMSPQPGTQMIGGGGIAAMGGGTMVLLLGGVLLVMMANK